MCLPAWCIGKVGSGNMLRFAHTAAWGSDREITYAVAITGDKTCFMSASWRQGGMLAAMPRQVPALQGPPARPNSLQPSHSHIGFYRSQTAGGNSSTSRVELVLIRARRLSQTGCRCFSGGYTYSSITSQPSLCCTGSVKHLNMHFILSMLEIISLFSRAFKYVLNLGI